MRRTWARVVEREHLRPAAAGAGLLRAFPAAGAPGVADLRDHEEPDPLLQPAFPVDVRARGPRHVSARTGADRKRGRRHGRRARVRVRAVSHRERPTPAGAVVRLDAVRAVRPAPALCDRTAWTTRRRRGRVARAEPVVRLLPAVLHAGRRPVHRVGADAPRVVERWPRADAHRRRRRVRARRDGAIPAAVRRAPAARIQPAVARRNAALLPPTSTPTSPPIRTCACGARSRRRGRSQKGCCFQA